MFLRLSRELYAKYMAELENIGFSTTLSIFVHLSIKLKNQLHCLSLYSLIISMHIEDDELVSALPKLDDHMSNPALMRLSLISLGVAFHSSLALYIVLN